MKEIRSGYIRQVCSRIRGSTHRPLIRIQVLQQRSIGCADDSVRVSLCADQEYGFGHGTNPEGIGHFCCAPVDRCRIWQVGLDNGKLSNKRWILSRVVIEEPKLTDEAVRSGVLVVVLRRVLVDLAGVGRHDGNVGIDGLDGVVKVRKTVRLVSG